MRSLWNKWKKIAQKIGDIQTTILFSILYFLLVIPIGLISQLKNDYLRKKEFPYWIEIADNSSTMKKLKQQS